MASILLHRPDGHVLEIDNDKISLIDDAAPGVYDKHVKTVVRVDGENHGVTETREEIDAIRSKAK